MVTIKSYTDISQSKKLTKILPPESADMWYQHIGWEHLADNSEVPTYFPMVIRDCKSDADIPCWSTSALLEIIRNNGRYELQMYEGGYYFATSLFITESYFNPVDACVEMVIQLYKLYNKHYK